MSRLFPLVLAILAGGAIAASVEQDVQRYLEVLKQSDPRFQATEFEALSGMGLSDPKLFDAVEQRLLDDYEGARDDRENRARVAWYFRALGFSGQAKYEPTLKRFTDDRTYRNYAVAALRDRPHYEKWNPVISSRERFDPKLSDDANRALNMLRSDDHELQRVGAKRVFLTHEKDPTVADMLAEKLRASYKTATSDEAIETTGWLVNALSRAGSENHMKLLAEVAKTAPSEKLRRRAQSVLDRRR